jgi:hypothetical protein
MGVRRQRYPIAVLVRQKKRVLTGLKVVRTFPLSVARAIAS